MGVTLYGVNEKHFFLVPRFAKGSSIRIKFSGQLNINSEKKYQVGVQIWFSDFEQLSCSNFIKLKNVIEWVVFD